MIDRSERKREGEGSTVTTGPALACSPYRATGTRTSRWAPLVSYDTKAPDLSVGHPACTRAHAALLLHRLSQSHSS